MANVGVNVKIQKNIAYVKKILFVIAITCYHYGQNKNILTHNNINWTIMNFKKLVLKMACVIISMT